MDRIKKVFQTLADSNRLKILHSISDSKMSVGELVKITRLSQPLVSFHMKVLKQNGFVATTRKGPFIYYSIEDKRLLKAIDLFLDIFNEKEAETNELMPFCPSYKTRKKSNRKINK
jgi:DNA-binding transcriptional ArsR family regulator